MNIDKSVRYYFAGNDQKEIKLPADRELAHIAVTLASDNGFCFRYLQRQTGGCHERG
jgi:hypothetical protein